MPACCCTMLRGWHTSKQILNKTIFRSAKHVTDDWFYKVRSQAILKQDEQRHRGTLILAVKWLLRYEAKKKRKQYTAAACPMYWINGPMNCKLEDVKTRWIWGFLEENSRKANFCHPNNVLPFYFIFINFKFMFFRFLFVFSNK